MDITEGPVIELFREVFKDMAGAKSLGDGGDRTNGDGASAAGDAGVTQRMDTDELADSGAAIPPHPSPSGNSDGAAQPMEAGEAVMGSSDAQTLGRSRCDETDQARPVMVDAGAILHAPSPSRSRQQRTENRADPPETRNGAAVRARTAQQPSTPADLDDSMGLAAAIEETPASIVTRDFFTGLDSVDMSNANQPIRFPMSGQSMVTPDLLTFIEALQRRKHEEWPTCDYQGTPLFDATESSWVDQRWTFTADFPSADQSIRATLFMYCNYFEGTAVGMLSIGNASPQPGFPPVEKSYIDNLAGACDRIRQDLLLQSREWVFDMASEVYLDFPDPTDAVEELSKALRTTYLSDTTTKYVERETVYHGTLRYIKGCHTGMKYEGEIMTHDSALDPYYAE
eukprot:3883126-Prymnesium_polylepis.1